MSADVSLPANPAPAHTAVVNAPGAYPTPARRRLITLAVLAATFMTQLDMTIANVALPHMQASTSASREQISWVLTSYIIMVATFTPLSGWLASRIGRKKVMLIAVMGFTLASALCGMAQTLAELIAFRMLQGMMGSALVPISQAIMLDINPPERHGSALALWGLGPTMGPIIGPLAGGWITDNLNWRWVFYINVPVGILTIVGLLAFMTSGDRRGRNGLDLFGFGLLAVAICALQLMLDRGQLQGWFDSREIWVEMVIAVAAFYLVVVHSLTAPRPFVNPSLFADRNFIAGNVLGMFQAGLAYGVAALLAPMLAELMGYPVTLVGLVTAPRGLGTLVAMLLTGRLVNRLDGRLLILAGLALCGFSTWAMAGFSLEMDSRMLLISGFVQGVGQGMISVPIFAIVFATIPARVRNEGAAMGSLIRNLGGAMTIAALQAVTAQNEAAVHARLVEGVRPDNPVLALRMPSLDFASTRAMTLLDGEIGRQALMVAYVDSYWLLFLVGLIMMPLLFLVRPAKSAS